MTGLLLFSVLLLAWSSASSPGQPDHLNHHNDDSDVFCYNPCCLVIGHQRVVQGLATELNFSFDAFGRTFDLKLFPEKDVFSSTPTVHYSDDTVHDVDISHLYRGTVRGVPGSSVHLYVLDGWAEGYMVFPGETARYYFKPARCLVSGQPSDLIVLDQTQAAETDERNSKENPRKKCSVADCFKMQDYINLSCDASSSVCRSYSGIKRMPAFHENWIPCVETRGKVRFTWFRENVCTLHLIADPTLWRHFKYERFRTTLSDKKTKGEIRKFFADRVSALKRMFVNTEFTTYDGRDMFRGIDFAMDRLTIMTDTTENCATSRPNAFCLPDLTKDEFTRRIYYMKHDKYCLAIFFTYRDFNGVVSGTPIAGRHHRGGGICDHSDTFVGNQTTGNFVWVTLLNKTGTYRDEASNVILAQAVGRAFGSTHDDVVHCVPGAMSPRGNYLMFNEFGFQNETFSICSKDSITQFLPSVIYGWHGRYNCLKSSVSGDGLFSRSFLPKHFPGIDYSMFPKIGHKLNDEL